jgi:alkanesulfonate monooxygenase SsuD/methylene tetrahydromethanopterin reductase-like flavin-dependent oxidoreductase (luciferase family)
MSVGTAEQVRDDLERRRREADADELVITTQVHDPAERRRSYELIADAYRVSK